AMAIRRQGLPRTGHPRLQDRDRLQAAAPPIEAVGANHRGLVRRQPRQTLRVPKMRARRLDRRQRQVLQRSALLARLSDDEIDAILKHAVTRRYAANAQIICKGDPGSSMMVVLRSRVAIRAPCLEGKEVILNLINEEEILGEIALRDGKERTADAMAMTD